MSNPAEQPERWEYTILMLAADSSKQQAFFDQYAPGQRVRPYDYRALIPQLDALGADGWELVTLVLPRWETTVISSSGVEAVNMVAKYMVIHLSLHVQAPGTVRGNSTYNYRI